MKIGELLTKGGSVSAIEIYNNRSLMRCYRNCDGITKDKRDYEIKSYRVSHGILKINTDNFDTDLVISKKEFELMKNEIEQLRKEKQEIYAKANLFYKNVKSYVENNTLNKKYADCIMETLKHRGEKL